MYRKKDSFVIGIDFGTDSARAILVNVLNGKVLATSVHPYRRWNEGKFCDPKANRFRQHPLDYIESLEFIVKSCVKDLDEGSRLRVIGISIATTGSTPVAVDERGTPLALLESFRNNPNAMFVLWKDHTAIQEAEEINQVSTRYNTDYLKFVGGVYSSEWYWAKLLHVIRRDPELHKSCYTWVEHSDWVPFLLTGGKRAGEIKRNICAAGHKALWAEEFKGLPSEEFFDEIDSKLVPYFHRFGRSVYSAEDSAGYLCKEWAEKFGLSEAVKVGVGAIDAHIGAVGGQIQPYYMSKVIGTSTCDMMVVPKEDMKDVFIDGIAGQVEGSIVPGMVGLEAGQSAFGDIYSWFRETLLWPLKEKQGDQDMESGLIEKLRATLLQKLDEEAFGLPLKEDMEFALDWFNGRRTPNANPNLTGLIGGLTLGSSPPQIYRALVESTCFGSRNIIESIEGQGIEVMGVNALGGIAIKSRYVMQTLSDVLNRPVNIITETQPVALGAAMFASVVAGIYPDILAASEKMKTANNRIVFPREEYVNLYNKKFKKYKQYGEFQDSLIK